MKVLHKPEKAPLLGKIRAEFSRKGVLAFFGVSSVLDPEVSIHSAEFNLAVESLQNAMTTIRSEPKK